MSGYLDVKCPTWAQRGLYIFKAWKRQWCILRPHPTEENTGVLAIHSSVDVLANSTIEFPPGSTVCRTKSRSHEHAFGVFLAGSFRKPRILLAGQTEAETQMWIGKIRAVLSGKIQLRKNLLKTTYDISIIDSEFSRKCLIYNVDCVLAVTSNGLVVSQSNSNLNMLISWKHFNDITLAKSTNSNSNKLCYLFINSGFAQGAGKLSILCPSAPDLVQTVREGYSESALKDQRRRISRSEGDIYSWALTSRDDAGGAGHCSWYSGPSDVSLDDSDLSIAKDANRFGNLFRCTADEGVFQRSVSGIGGERKYLHTLAHSSANNRSCTSLSSGIYEEIPDHHIPRATIDSLDATEHVIMETENEYESVDCVFATMRRTKKFLPPPLPPRTPNSSKQTDSWSSHTDCSDEVDSRHNSLGALPVFYSSSGHVKTLPKASKGKPFSSVFRKRIKSESRASPTKSDTKKKKFDFSAPTIEMLKNLAVSRVLMRNMKVSAPEVRKLGESRSCEWLEEVTEIAEARCSRSEETLRDEGEDLSGYEEQFSLPQDIVELILKGRDDLASERLRLRQLSESDYICMSPAAPTLPVPQTEEHYTIMTSPANIQPPVKTDIAT